MGKFSKEKFAWPDMGKNLLQLDNTVIICSLKRPKYGANQIQIQDKYLLGVTAGLFQMFDQSIPATVCDNAKFTSTKVVSPSAMLIPTLFPSNNKAPPVSKPCKVRV